MLGEKKVSLHKDRELAKSFAAKLSVTLIEAIGFDLRYRFTTSIFPVGGTEHARIAPAILG
jgi:hypothetical protein